MKQLSIEKFSGLQIQPNSFTTPPGSFEKADNIVVSQDYLITKTRGYFTDFEAPVGQVFNRLFDYNGYVFGLSQNALYKFIQTATTAQGKCFSGSPLITVRKTSHGLRNGDSVSDIRVLNTDAFVAAFPNRHVDFSGDRPITTTFNLAVATRAANVVTVTLSNHGMNVGDRITVSASTISVSAGTYTLTAVTTNTFSFANIGANSSGTVSFAMVDSFRFTANNNAQSSVTSGATALSYLYYVIQTGQSISITSAGVGVSRVVKSNKNAYFTSDNGLLKLERNDLPVLKAGIPPGLDLYVTLGLSNNGTSGFVGPVKPQYSLAYRILFGRKDANNNFVLGAPSQFYIVRNSALTSVGNANLSYNAGTGALTVTQSNSFTAGEYVYLYGCTGFTPSIPDGTRVLITSASAGSFVVDLSPLGVTAATISIQYGTELTPLVTFTVPNGIESTEYIYRIYRTDQVAGVTSTPDPNTYKLVQENNLTSQQIADNYVDFYDTLDDILIEGNPTLYTNPNNEGELQANARPPLSTDVCLFKNYVFYANNTQYKTLDLSVVAPSLITAGDILTIGTQNYIFRGDAGDNQIGNQRLTSPAVGAGPVTITQFQHGFQNGDIVVVNGSSGITGFSGTGTYAVFGVTANTFNIGGSGAAGAGFVTYEGLTDSTGRRLVKLLVPATVAGVTLSEAIDQTARYICKAINRNPNSTVYCQYISDITGAPGKLFLIAQDLNASDYAVTISNANASDAFLPSVPTSGTTVSGTSTSAPNELLVAKLNEPEAVPPTNSFLVGSQADQILRIAALRDSVIILKEDGVFRLNGDSINNFTVTALDTTVICKSTDSVAVLNNSVYAFTNQGVVQITDTSVRILSRPIEPFLSAIVGDSDLENYTSGISYESERLYLLATKRPNSSATVADVIYCYNYLNDAWTTWSGTNVVFANGFVSTLDDKMLVIPANATRKISKERKDNTKIDYTGEYTGVQTINALVSATQCFIGTPTLTVTSKYDHGLVTGQIVTISRTSGTLGTGFSGGVSDVNGLRIVSNVDDAKTFSFDAATNALTNINSFVFYKPGIVEFDATADTTSGSRQVLVTTPIAHQLTSGMSINVNQLSSAIGSTFAQSSDLTGFRSIVVQSPTTFTIVASNPATGTATGTINITDRSIDTTLCTLNVPTTIIPQAGDCVILNRNLYKMDSVFKYSTQYYNVAFLSDYTGVSWDATFLHSAYKSSFKFNPITGGNTGQLKYFPEFQTSFRTQSSCTSAIVNFANDGFPGTTPTNWSFKVGTTKTAITFGGWGQLNWGEFPWGGEVSIDKEFVTTSAVIMRIYVPKETFVGTFLQPSFDHKIAGEPIEVQSISFLTRPVTERTTK